MTTVKTIIVDDERLARAELRGMLEVVRFYRKFAAKPPMRPKP